MPSAKTGGGPDQPRCAKPGATTVALSLNTEGPGDRIGL
jgi:hypothetical protein